MRWLIAEDETDIRNLVTMMCQVWGHTPMAFESGQKAWDWMDSVEAGTYDGPLPEFALMDIRMPGYRGNIVARRLRTIPQLQHIPIVLMTAFVLSDKDHREMLEECGVDYIVNKPLPEFETLHKLLHNIIDRKLSRKS